MRRPVPQALFWPKVGRLYDGELLQDGRAVNGWIDRWEPDDPRSPAELAAIARRTGEGTVDGCPMGWVLDRRGKRDGGYDTARSQYWETARRIVTTLVPRFRWRVAEPLAWLYFVMADGRVEVVIEPH